MFFKKAKEKHMKMVWEVEKGDRRSLLVGTSHFFPYSFKKSLNRCLEGTRMALFEGPLDDQNMAKVVRAGMAGETRYHLFDDLDSETIEKLTKALAPNHRLPDSFVVFKLCKLQSDNPVYDMVCGMKPWLAFFTLWHGFLKQNGWKYSVDKEAYDLAREAGKKTVFLETIEEQIEVLESLSQERFLSFLKQVDHWLDFAVGYARNYLEGKLDHLGSMRLGFPSRHESVIKHRDRIFYERMKGFLEEGRIVAFVGVPHIRGMSELIRKDGYRIRGPGISKQEG